MKIDTMKMKWLPLLLFAFAARAFAFEIYAEVSAAIVSIKPLGSVFEKGEVLVELNDAQAKLELSHRQKLVEIQRQELDDKEEELEQAQELFDRIVISHRDLERAELAFNRAQTMFQAREIQVKIAERELEKYRILAPFAGVVLKIPHPRNATNINAPKILLVIEEREN